MKGKRRILIIITTLITFHQVSLHYYLENFHDMSYGKLLLKTHIENTIFKAN